MQQFECKHLAFPSHQSVHWDLRQNAWIFTGVPSTKGSSCSAIPTSTEVSLTRLEVPIQHQLLHIGAVGKLPRCQRLGCSCLQCVWNRRVTLWHSAKCQLPPYAMLPGTLHTEFADLAFAVLHGKFIIFTNMFGYAFSRQWKEEA